MAALIGFLTMNLTDHPSNLTRISVAFWMILGVVMGSAPARWRSTKAAPRPATCASISGELPMPKPGPADEPTERIDPLKQTEPIARSPRLRPHGRYR